ncbi:PEP-utilizing enzyme [Halorubrum sp. HHNYT27]|uniref:PEP-utilizing enzyme n=1 Tax=Halorubrum sp. HHNYT27 TaxID=3402275 RepID=UPI003EBCCA95
MDPLFTKAAAIVTDIGGPLSHGSIIAREYAIPALLGTSVATERIRDGQQLTVDGNGGTVTILVLLQANRDYDNESVHQREDHDRLWRARGRPVRRSRYGSDDGSRSCFRLLGDSHGSTSNTTPMSPRAVPISHSTHR